MDRLGVLTHHFALFVLRRHLCCSCARTRLKDLLSVRVLLRERSNTRYLRPRFYFATEPRDCGGETGRSFAASLVKGAMLLEIVVLCREFVSAIE
jgi:hypothetical protein